jgi:hypothetical protein
MLHIKVRNVGKSVALKLLVKRSVVDEVRGVFGGVDGEGGGDCEEGRGEGCDGELLS